MNTTTATYEVEGMTCGHCVNTVSTDVGRLDGVTGVEVDLTTGTVTVTSSGSVPDEVVGAAIEAAGYRVVS